VPVRSESDDIFPAADSDSTAVAVTSPDLRLATTTEPGVPQVQAAASTAVANNTNNSAAATNSADATIRVRTDRLDRLIDMVGELVIAQSMIAGDEGFSNGTQHELLRKVTHAGKIVRELQDLSMSMRMVPLRPTFQKLARVVRDTATKAGKTVQFVTEGDEVEIDRTMVDRLGDPLVHMVRNAVDHGVEPPHERTANGKKSLGVVRLHAYHASGNVVVELIDDGRGLHRDKIVKKAIEKGLIESDKGMTDSEVFNLIFAPGFSTAEKVTDISGRGVGMDVVRTNIMRLGGNIHLDSNVGRGTSFAMFMPLSAAVQEVLLVAAANQILAIPARYVAEVIELNEEDIQSVKGRKAILLRGNFLPIARLDELLGYARPGDGAREPHRFAVVLSDAQRMLGVSVAEIVGRHELFTKDVHPRLTELPGVGGASILGDGRVVLILDCAAIYRLAENVGGDAPAALEQ